MVVGALSQESIYRHMVESISHGVYLFDREWRYMLINDAGARFLRMKKEDMLGKRIFDLSPGILETGFGKLLKRVMETREPGVVHEEFTYEDGRNRWYEVRAYPVADGIFTIANDITEHKKAEYELEESRKHFKTLFNVTVDPVVIVDSQGTIVEITERVEEITGFKREELVGKQFMKTSILTEESKAVVLENLARRLRGISIAPYEVEVLTKDRRKIPYEINAEKIEYRGKPAVMAAFRDITERKLIEEELRKSRERYIKLFAFSPVGTAMTDLEGRYLEVNRAYAKIFGVSEKNLLGRKVTELIEEEESRKTQEDINELFTKGYSEGVRELRIFDKKLILSYVNTLLYDEEKKPVAIISMIQDITERRHMEEQLLKAERFAAIGELASIVGHEIRNPLGVIQNSAYYLKMRLKEADEKVARHLDILLKEVNRGNTIISDLLNFAQGPKPPTLQLVDLNQIVVEALSRIDIPKIVETATILGKLSKLRADSNQILRVLLNLMMNGIQAMPEGGTLSIKTDDSEGFVEVSIIDTGVGIPEENMEKLFTPLFSTKAKGVGLGLYISKGIVEAHGGTITVQSKVGKGSTFIIRLPTAEEG